MAIGADRPDTRHDHHDVDQRRNEAGPAAGRLTCNFCWKKRELSFAWEDPNRSEVRYRFALHIPIKPPSGFDKVRFARTATYGIAKAVRIRKLTWPQAEEDGEVG